MAVAVGIIFLTKQKHRSLTVLIIAGEGFEPSISGL